VNEADSCILQVFLKPGELYVADCPTIVTTLLGSCLSVTMFSPQHRIGAICHAVLPCEQGVCWDTRYVDSSIILMLRHFTHLSIKRSHLQVKLFGGADIGSRGKGGSLLSVGSQNVTAALRVIKEQNLILAASDLGGARGRKIVFYAHTGEVYLQRVLGIEEH
jgi:chemotaxis protein CheD